VHLPSRYFAVVREPGSRWNDSKPVREQSGWDDHAVFMDGLAGEGFITVGGPLGDGQRALHVVDAADEAEIRRRFSDDPWVAIDVLVTVRVEPWEIWLGRDLLASADRKLVTLFVLTQVAGPSWDASRQRREQDGWDEHAAFMDALVEDGFVVLGGPLGDGERVLLVVEAGEEAEIESRLAEDPWIKDGTLRVDSIEPWTVWLDGRRQT
jgi:uncharacterized protein YciI